jgi:hypothetical protein
VWQVSGPGRPAAGETATYVVRGPSGHDYDVVVKRGAVGCARALIAGDPAQTLARYSFLNGNGVDSLQLSFDAGRSTICLYDNATASIADSKRIRTIRGKDRLRISVANTTTSDAYATATGYVGREGDPLFADAATQHNATVLITARAPQSRCPRAAPSPFAPRTASQEVTTARFSVDLTIIAALTASNRPRLCGYLTAKRRGSGGVRAHTVATDSAVVPDAGVVIGSDGGRIAAITAGVLLAIAAVVGLTILFLRGRASAGTASAAVDAKSHGLHAVAPHVVQDPPVSTWPAYDAIQSRDVEVSFAIQRAVAATAAVFGERLQTVLLTRDGVAWLEAFNQRRRLDMLGKGQRAPSSYAAFEPRAVLNCLAYDPVALQLINAEAVAAARQLSGLANAAHHPDPANPLTEEDAKRAWRLYSQITGEPSRPDARQP